jgi:hypothetical protein
VPVRIGGPVSAGTRAGAPGAGLLALPEDQPDQVSADAIADMAARAFSGGFPALA